MAQYDVVGTDGDAPPFIRHAGLASNSGTHDRSAIYVVDMKPPLSVDSAIRADVVERPQLTDAEARRIKDFIDRHDFEHRAVEHPLGRDSIPKVYCIFPHAIPSEEKHGKANSRTRFSCAGFVFEAYRRAGIHMFDERQLPLVTLEQIRKAYPGLRSILEHQSFRESMGLTGSGPWPVMLCGYLVNSLNRDPNSIRGELYAVQKGDEMFPNS